MSLTDGSSFQVTGNKSGSNLAIDSDVPITAATASPRKRVSISAKTG